MVEDDIRLILDQQNSSFITYELQPSIYTFKDPSEDLLRNRQHEFDGDDNAIHNEFDDITMKTKLVVKPGIIAIRFDEKLFFNTILGFDLPWVYKHYNEYISQKIINLSTRDKIHLKCDVIDGFIMNGFQQPVLFSFILDKPAGYKVFCEPETIHYIKVNKSAFNTIVFYLEDDINEKLDFNQETLTFTSQLIKIYTTKRAFKNLKKILIALVVDTDLLQ